MSTNNTVHTLVANATEHQERPAINQMVLGGDSMDKMLRLADVMATSKCTVPTEYRNSPGDCLAVVMQAMQWGMNPFALAQKTHFISGKICYEAQLVNAVITSMSPTRDRLHYEWFGDWSKVIGKFQIKKGEKGEYRVPGWTMADEECLGVRVWATLNGETEPRELELLLAQARTRNSTLWADDPRQQLAYLAVKRWARLYVPDVILGVYTPDEYETVGTVEVVSDAGTRAAEVIRAPRRKSEANHDKPAQVVTDHSAGQEQTEAQPETDVQATVEITKSARKRAAWIENKCAALEIDVDDVLQHVGAANFVTELTDAEYDKIKAYLLAL